MKQIASFCDNKEQKTQNNIHETETISKLMKLKQSRNNNWDDYEEIIIAIKSNETTTKQLLQQRKFKKFT